MEAQWIRSYRPHQDRFDERPAVLNAGYVATDITALVLVVSAALAKRGNVVIEQGTWCLTDDIAKSHYAQMRAREAERVERRS